MAGSGSHSHSHSHSLSRTVALALALALGACTSPSVPASSPSAEVVPRLRFLHASDGEVGAVVRAALDTAHAEHRTLLVYVGASWCEPCGYFHAAAERGDLDTELPPILLLEFDRDRDGARLDAAGYGSEMIPLFVVPSSDGRPSEGRIEGSIHGPGSPLQIAPRLRAIL